MTETFHAMIVEAHEDGTFSRRIGTRTTADLPAGELLVRVHHSSLNYKDALSAIGRRGVTRSYPHTPGIDAAGTVAASQEPAFGEGDDVIVIGYDLGVNTAGGFGQYIRVPAGWAVKRPAGLTLRDSMILGTAGYTAAQCVQALVDGGLQPEKGPVVVTGATGGVGSVAIALLSQLGFEVVAATGKAGEKAYLQDLGARRVIGREEVDDPDGRPLLRETWAGGVDTVGGSMLATLLKSTRYEGIVTACGLVAGPDLPTTVYPFILRGVTLRGIDSVNQPIAARQELWTKLAGPWRLADAILDRIGRLVVLDELSDEIDRILAGGQRGRVVVDLG